jgi:cation transport regulator ChaC
VLLQIGTLNAPEILRLHLDNGKVAIFGYGSLILLESMERTLGRKYTLSRYACHLRGWKRVWTSLYPNSTFYFLGPDGERSYPKNILYLNVCRSDVSINGVVYVICHR